MDNVEPPAAGNILGYQSPANVSLSANSLRASRVLKLLGGLTFLTGVVLGGLVLLVQAVIAGETFPPGSYVLSARDWFLVAMIFIVPGALGIAEIICGMKIKKQSTTAGVTAIVLVSAHLPAAIFVFWRWRVPGMVATVIFLAMLTLGVAAMICTMAVLRENLRGR